MKITKATVKNFRLLYNVGVDFHEHTTSIVGKNNSGKTSFTSLFDNFLNDRVFRYEDFSVQAYDQFWECYQLLKTTELTPEEKEEQIRNLIPKIQLFLTIQYSDVDNWSNLRPFITSLEENDVIKILLEYAPQSSIVFLESVLILENEGDDKEAVLDRIELLFKEHYVKKYRPISGEGVNTIRLKDIQRLISSNFIYAQRALDDSGESAKSKLSKVFETEYRSEDEKNNTASEALQQSITTASKEIDEQLEIFFKPFKKSFEDFGFPNLDEEEVFLHSELNPDLLFRNNVRLFYNQSGKALPEKYNGLGYSNLIYIISQIIAFQKKAATKGTDLNLIFIEEPEAHMHPQMQTVFIQKINTFLAKKKIQAQVILTTHSSHMLAHAPFESIRYFLRCNSEKCISKVKDLATFKRKHTDTLPDTLAFLQQYLTLGRCDLFFADKAILFEGTVERILLPVFIEKSAKKLLSEYVTSVEVGGTYMSHFRELLEFLELKTLIITDIDSIRATSREGCKVTMGENLRTSNSTLKSWLPGKELIDDLLTVDDVHKENTTGSIRVAYQQNRIKGREHKCGRSFEEAFIIDNSKYIHNNKEKLQSISHHNQKASTDEVWSDSYGYQEFIDRNKKKTDFAFDLLSVKKEAWDTPSYIKQGLEWLAQ